MPRLLSEYLAARAQSLGLIRAAHAMVDPTMVGARANRIGERTLAACRRWHSAFANFSLTRRFVDSLRRTKVRFGGTPKPESRPRRHRQVTLPEFLDIGQLVEGAQPEMIEEKRCRLIKQGAAWNFSAPGNFDETALQQGLQYSVDGDAADAFDIRPGDRLPIRDDGERLQRRRAQSRRFGRGEQLTHPFGVGRIAHELPAFGLFDELKRVLLLNVFGFQLLERCRHFSFTHPRELVRLKLIVGPRAT